MHKEYVFKTYVRSKGHKSMFSKHTFQSERTKSMFWKHTFPPKITKSMFSKHTLQPKRHKKYVSVFSVSFLNPRNHTRETLVIPLDGYEASLQISFEPLKRLKVTEVTRVLRTETKNTGTFENILFDQKGTKSMFWEHTFQSKCPESMFSKHTFRSKWKKKQAMDVYECCSVF